MQLLKNISWLYRGNGDWEPKKDSHIVIKEGKIEKIVIGEEPSEADWDEVIDCRNMLVMPGLINTHHHFYQTLTRNLPGAQQAKLFDWLVYLYPIWAGIDESAIRSATTIAAAELFLTGCTTSVDHFYLYPHGHDELFDVELQTAREVGLRLALCRGSMSLSQKDGGLPPDHVTQSVDRILKHTRDVLERYVVGQEADPLTQVIVAPCSPFSVSRDLMRESKTLAKQYQVPCHTHLAETLDEDQYCLERYGCRPMQYLEQVGWLDEHTFLAHMVWVNDEEIELLAKRGTGVAHCPSSNMRLGSGIAPIVKMHQKGVPVGIAVDGSASNDGSHMLGEVRQALLLQRVKEGAGALTARDVLQMATMGGARLIGRMDLGHLSEGATADLIGINMDRPQFAGSLSDPLAALVFCMTPQVDLTMVQGNIVVRNGALVNIDVERAVHTHNEIAESLLKR